MLGQHIYCQVQFTTGKWYYYRATDNSLQVGDFVIVPAGMIGEQKIGQVVGIQRCSRFNAPYPVNKTKLIIKKATERSVKGVQRHNIKIQKKYIRQQNEKQKAEQKRIKDAEIDALMFYSEIFDDDNH